VRSAGGDGVAGEGEFAEETAVEGADLGCGLRHSGGEDVCDWEYYRFVIVGSIGVRSTKVTAEVLRRTHGRKVVEGAWANRLHVRDFVLHLL
jgi:hypothetical protein